MNRSLKLPLLVALALGSGHALALDLGQIQVKSALGQPLLAEIPVQQATAAELQQLSVQLASGDEFTRAGVSNGRPSMPLRFDVVDGANGHKLIRITSEAAVNDPFLDLLVEINAGAGKSVREYTILLDPPSTPVATRSHGARAAKAAAPAAAPAPATRAGKAPAEATSQVANGRYGPVARGQTLSEVAHQTAPAGVGLNQMLLALKQANPDAFYRDNINALKAGAVLRIPDKAEAEAVAVAAAAEEVRRQNGDWRSGTVSSSPVTVADAATRSGTSSSPTAGSAGNGDHLALVPARQGAKTAAAAGDAGKDGTLRQDLQRSQESLASLQQQSEDLKSRLKDLGDINSKNERLLALKDSEIAELQQKLAAARKAAGQPAEAVAAVSAAAAAAGAGAAKPAERPASAASAPAANPAVATAASSAKPEAGPAGAATAAATSQPAPAAAQVRTTPVKPTAIKPAAPAPEEPWYSQLWVQALGGAVVVLLLLGALLGRRKAKPAAAQAPKLAPSLADRFGGGAPADGDDDQNLLLDQLAEHPDDIGLHLELVSLYYGRRDVEHFEAAAEAMHAHVTDPRQEEWQEVLHMGEDLVPGHPLFAAHGGLSADELEAHHGFDIDRYAAEPVATAAVATPAPAPPPLPANPVTVSEYNFNFDLSPAQKRAEEGNTAAAQQAPVHHLADEDAATPHEAASSWHFEEPEVQIQPDGHDIEPRDFSDDPVDTKLDLARAYLDMGDAEGARAMLEEVLHEGSQMQRDVAKRMIEDLH
ncbi:MAG: fimbrial protein FimV [Rhodanobacter sp. 68-29]|nr:fimbrial protein FimV [Rhodanobacter sp.]ODU73781.1 MAG: fimbrial protein FimV [Rhodanobacter sp. SCN 69-32]OJY59517.1 MAG: fimbrial protein FimV [Rhodanobacter sp. 68-29]